MNPKEKQTREERQWSDTKTDAFYRQGRHAVDPYVFPEDGSLDVVHEGVLSQMITLFDVPFHEMEELQLPECFGDRHSLARAEGSFKASKTQNGGAKVRYTYKEAKDWKEQATACEICGTLFEFSSDKHGDHSHKTGEWRGVLCNKCNMAIGMLKDSPELCEAAAEYLRKSL